MSINKENNEKENKFISLVIYLHNAEADIRAFLDHVLPACTGFFKECELICVEDDCTDDTIGMVREYLQEKKMDIMVNVIHMSYFHGVEAAMNAGRDLSIGDIIYEFDSVCVDYQASLLIELYQRLIEGHDIVVAGRKGKGKLTSRLFYKLYNQTSRMKGEIGSETFRIISRRAVNRVKSMGEFIPYRKAIYMNCGLKTDVIYYESTGRKISSGAHREERTSLALDSFIYFTNAVEKASLILSCLFLAITAAVACYIIYDFLSMDSRPIEGWVSTMGFIAFGFMGVFSLLTIILKYLSVMLNLIFQRQRYLVEGIEKLGGEKS